MMMYFIMAKNRLYLALNTTKKENFMRRHLKTCFLGLILLSLTLSGCNTVAGAGEDIQSGGRAIQRAAE
jgi:entericidin B